MNNNGYKTSKNRSLGNNRYNYNPGNLYPDNIIEERCNS